MYLILIFCLALLLRLVLLGSFPISITHDEHEYIMHAKSIAFTGQLIPGSPPLGLFSWGTLQPAENVLAELPAFFIAPFAFISGSSSFMVRLPFALASSVSVILIYFIFKALTANRSLALFASLILALNPWSIHFGRTSFEFTLSILFYLLGIYFLIRSHKWMIFYSLLFFVIGFLSYHGAKVLLFPLVAVISVWKFSESKSDKKYLLILIGASLLISVAYFATLNYQPSSARSEEIIFFSDQAATAVNKDRTQSVPGIQQELLVNKATYLLKTLADTYMGAFSTDLLFVSGEDRGAYSFWVHGIFYYIDLFLIIFGLTGLYITNRKAWWLILGIIAVSPLASILSVVGKSYVIRSGLVFPFLASLSGIGIWFLLRESGRYKRILGYSILLIYFVSVFNFLNIYFTRYPIYGSEGFFFSNKILSRYLKLTLNESKEVLIFTTEPRMLFEKFLFYNNLYTRETAEEMNNKIGKGDLSYKNLRFVGRCEDVTNDGGGILIHEAKLDCKFEASSSKISSTADAGTIFFINNDSICSKYERNSYPKVNRLSDLNVYDLSEEEFCKIWISFQ